MAARAFRRFRMQTQGNVGLIFASMFTVLIGMGGGAIDYGAYIKLHSLLRSMTDGAVLAAATARSASSTVDLQAVANAYMTANWTPQSGGVSAHVSVTDDGQGTIHGAASTSVPMSFITIFGYNQMTATVSAAAQYGAGRAEVALVLDNTGSMAGSKIAALQQAASQLVTVLYQAPGSDQMVKVGLVPFTYYVNVGMANRHAPWMSVAADSSTTTQTCGYVSPLVSQQCSTVSGTCTNDGVPYACSWQSCTNQVYGAPVYQCTNNTATYTWNGCAGSRT
jgi:Flp pilus assembly protein TadG